MGSFSDLFPESLIGRKERSAFGVAAVALLGDFTNIHSWGAVAVSTLLFKEGKMRSIKIFYFFLFGLFSMNLLAQKNVTVINRTGKTLLVSFCPKEIFFKFKRILTVEIPPRTERVYSSKIEGISLKKKGKVHFEIPGKETLNVNRAHYVKMPLGSYRKARKRLLRGREETFRVFAVPVLWYGVASYKFSKNEHPVYEVVEDSSDKGYSIRCYIDAEE